MRMFKFLLLSWMMLTGVAVANAQTPPIPQDQFHLSKPVVPIKVEDPELADVQVKIAKENRKFNTTNMQCVWCSIEALARHHGITNLYDLTNIYKNGTEPFFVRMVLNARKINFKQVHSGPIAGKQFLKEYVTEKKLGAGIGVGHIHMLNCVHYDEEKGIVKIIDNGGPYAMKVQTWTMQQFDQRFDGWAITLFPPQK